MNNIGAEMYSAQSMYALKEAYALANARVIFLWKSRKCSAEEYRELAMKIDKIFDFMCEELKNPVREIHGSRV